MISKRAKLTTTATIAGLGALAGIAVETNHGMPATTVATVNGHEIVTRTSGGTTVTAGGTRTKRGRAPIVTRASGAAQSSPPAWDSDESS
jgi:hypothetical protein